MKKKQQRDREQAIKCYLKGDSITTIARKLGYSRPRVYKWIERYQASSEQESWHEEQTRAPHSNPRQLPGGYCQVNVMKEKKPILLNTSAVRCPSLTSHRNAAHFSPDAKP
jgi:transposase-like protein